MLKKIKKIQTEQNKKKTAKAVIKCSENERTIRSLVTKVGKVYLHFDSQETWDAFVNMAVQEGFLLGGEAPTSAGMDNVIAVCRDGTICYLGWAGRVCYQCNQVPRIEFSKFIAGEKNYIV